MKQKEVEVMKFEVNNLISDIIRFVVCNWYSNLILKNNLVLNNNLSVSRYVACSVVREV